MSERKTALLSRRGFVPPSQRKKKALETDICFSGAIFNSNPKSPAGTRGIPRVRKSHFGWGFAVALNEINPAAPRDASNGYLFKGHPAAPPVSLYAPPGRPPPRRRAQTAIFIRAVPLRCPFPFTRPRAPPRRRAQTAISMDI